jgi:hypothetical protein
MGAAMLRKGDKAGALEEYKILKNLDSDMAQDLFNRIYPNDEPSTKSERTTKQPKS